MTSTRAIYNSNGEIEHFVPGPDYENGAEIWIATPLSRPSAVRVPPLLIALVLGLALGAGLIGILRYYSEQPAAWSLQLDNPGPRAPASAGVVVSGAAAP